MFVSDGSICAADTSIKPLMGFDMESHTCKQCVAVFWYSHTAVVFCIIYLTVGSEPDLTGPDRLVILGPSNGLFILFHSSCVHLKVSGRHRFFSFLPSNAQTQVQHTPPTVRTETSA